MRILMKRKLVYMLIILAIIALFFIIVFLTIFMSKGTTMQGFAFTEIAIITLGSIMIGYNIIQFQRNNKNKIIYLILANMFVMIVTIHLLRFTFGGLLC